MKTADGIPCVEPIPEERRVVHRARAGDASAFMDLYDAYGDDLFRYVYFRVLSDVAAEAITSQVLRHAWDHLRAFHWRKDASFVRWVYEIARTQVLIYYKANLKTTTFNIPSLLDAADYRLNAESQDENPPASWSHRLRLLTGDIEQSRLQTTAALIMRKYLEYLNPGRVTKPSPTFNAYTRTWLARYLDLHPHPSARARLRERLRAAGQRLPNVSTWRVPHIGLPPAGQRLAVVYAVLLLALLVTGTAKAQSALPGDFLYGWKLTSEQAWLTVSPDPLGTEITLADRRLDEMLALENDPVRSANAREAYLQALIKLNTSGDVEADVRIQPLLANHRQKLKESGLASTELEAFLAPLIVSETGTTTPEAGAAVISVAATPVATEAASVPVSADTQAVPTAESPTVAVVPTDTPQPTETPTEVTPTEVTPTEVTPTDVVPTEVTPTDEVPTEVATTAVPTTTDVVATPTLDPSLIDNTPTPSQ